MRIELHLSPNREIVPFNYQAALVGAFHRWLGPNELHDDTSLYSLSWLQGARKVRNGFDFPRGSTFYISSPNHELFQTLIPNMIKGTHIRWGMEVTQANIHLTPDFGEQQWFWARSPILIKRNVEGQAHQQYFFPKDAEANTLLTETLQYKMKRMGIELPVEVKFDPEFRNIKTKLITYKNIDIKATFCPVIVTGDPKAVSFAWDVGVGNSTGLGFGALR